MYVCMYVCTYRLLVPYSFANLHCLTSIHSFIHSFIRIVIICVISGEGSAYVTVRAYCAYEVEG